MPFLWNWDWLNEILKSFIFGGVLLSLWKGRFAMLSYHWCKISWNRINWPHEVLVLLETLGFMLKVCTCHYTGEIFFPEKQGFENGLFSPFLVIFCLHNAKCPCIFLPLATVAASVITNFQISNMCTSKKDKHYFWKLVA